MTAYTAKSRIKEHKFSDRLFVLFIYCFLTLLVIIAVYPLLLVISLSFSNELAVQRYGFRLIPAKWNLDTYSYMFSESSWVYRSYGVTLFVTSFGTIFSMIVTSMLAYPLSISALKYKSYIAFFVFFTLIFSSGLVPWFLVVRRVYRLKDNLFALILPALVNPWYMFLLRNYFRSIPSSLWESAKIDGAGDFLIFTRIALPLSIPVLATISLFYALFYWNDWWHALMLLDNRNLYPLQFQLFNIISNVLFLSQSAQVAALSANITVPAETVKAATTLIAIGPIILLYPFIQRYFIKGILIGAIKG